MSARIRTGQVLLVVLFALCAVISISTFFAEDPFPREACVLIASFGCAFALLGIVLATTSIRATAVRWGLWVLPLFFVSHVAMLGTWVPDAIFAIVSAAAIALTSGVRENEPAR